MFKKHRSSIQSLLFLYMILFAFLLLAVTSVLISLVQFRYARGEAMDSLRRTCVSVADSVDQQINQLNQISLNAVSSSDLQDVFDAYVSGESTGYEQSRLRSRLSNLLSSLRGLDFSIRQLSVYALPENTVGINGFGVGEHNGDLPVSAKVLPWYGEALDAAGRMVLTGPMDEVGILTGSVRSGESYLALSRLYYNLFHIPMGFVEVRKYYSDVFSLASAPELSYQAQIYVYGKDGRQIYPDPEESGERFDYYSCVEGGDQLVRNTLSGESEYVSFARAPSSDLVVAAVTRRSVLFGRILRTMTWILVPFALLAALALLASFAFSQRISSPIRRIYHFLADESKERFKPLDMELTGIREIDKLTASINENIRSTKIFTETLMTLKEQEVQAQMLALQSQMNPHFLYNSLSTIGEMAEEGLTESVADMCRMITEILRYISSNREQRSTLEEELEICDMYLECIRMRYGSQLVSSISVPDEMLEIMIPKLCIQLLVENAIRSVTTAAPPWRVSVECGLEPPEQADGPGTGEDADAAGSGDRVWKITVRDNGPGFDPAVDAHLRSQMDYILRNGVLPSLKIQGMGILNIIIRLYLLDGIPFVFDMGNNPEGGAFVTIGGRVRGD